MGKGMLRFLDEHAQAGRGIERAVFMAQLAAWRTEAPPRDLSLLALAAQGAYFTMGVMGHLSPAAAGGVASCALFPGRFARTMAGAAPLLPPELVPPAEIRAAGSSGVPVPAPTRTRERNAAPARRPPARRSRSP
jgi:hypothetical protein